MQPSVHPGMVRLSVLAAALLSHAASAQTIDQRGAVPPPVVYYERPAFVAAAPSALTVIGFDAGPACDGCLTGNEFAAQGMTFAQLDALGMNVVSNLVPGSHGGNFVTEACISSPPSAISSSIFVNGAGQQSDRFEFTFTTETHAAGAFIGNLGGGCCPENGTVVQFLGAGQAVLWSGVVSWNTAGAIFGPSGQTWDNRLFVGLTSDTPIVSMRILSGPNDGDGITIDDVQFATAAPPPACPGDADGNRTVSFVDITNVLASFGNNYGAPAPPGTNAGDANGDGVVNFLDITTVLANFGIVCP
jgi:hypothetical protein